MSVPPAPARPSAPALLRACAPVLLLILASVLVCAPAWTTLTGIWQDSFSYAHGWLIALVSLLLLAEVAPHLSPALRAQRGPLGALALAALAYVLADYGHVDLAQQLLLPVLPVLVLASAYGWRGARRVAFPLLYLWLAVPVWDLAVPLLQRLTVLANGAALYVLGVPAEIHGDLVRVPAGMFEVAGGCSGVHFFIVAVAIGVLHAYLRDRGPWPALRGVLVAMVLALATNWLRVLVIILRGNATQMQTPLIKDHYWFGWGLFAAAIGAYFVIMHLLDRAPLKPPVPAPARRLPAPAASVWVPGVAVLSALVGYGYLHARGWAEVAVPDLTPPRLSGEFAGPRLRDLDFRPSFPGAARTSLGTYGDDAIAYFQVAYLAQSTGSKLIGYGSSVVPEGWQVAAETIIDSPPATRGAVPARVLSSRLVAPTGRSWRVWSWYSVGGRTTPDSTTARGWQAAQLVQRLRPSGLSALAAPCVPDCDAALGSLESFAAILARKGHLMTHRAEPIAVPSLAAEPPLRGGGGSTP